MGGEVAKARQLRRSQTDSEWRLWMRLRNRQLDGWKFRRQVPVAGFFADFVCHDAKLVIEIDGSQHLETRATYDIRRTALIEAAGFHVLRFWSNDVLQNLDGVLTAIAAACAAAPSPRPSPAGGRGGALNSGRDGGL